MSGICMSRMARSSGSPRRTHSRASAGIPVSRVRMPHEPACLTRMCRFVSLSSTMSTRRPASCEGSARSYGRTGAGADSASIVKWKVDPSPTVLSTHIDPPISSASRLLMASPSPVLPYRRVVEGSTWLNDSNNRSIRSSGMPIPVSRTTKWTR